MGRPYHANAMIDSEAKGSTLQEPSLYVLIGQRIRTEPVLGGRVRTFGCQACGEPKMHVEHRTVRTAMLVLPIANVAEHAVWCCTSCGRRVAEGETRWLGDQAGTAVGQVMAAWDRWRNEAP